MFVKRCKICRKAKVSNPCACARLTTSDKPHLYVASIGSPGPLTMSVWTDDEWQDTKLTITKGTASDRTEYS